jgi:hypothetical protein
MLNFIPEDQAMEEGGKALDGERCFVDEEEDVVVFGEQRVFA